MACPALWGIRKDWVVEMGFPYLLCFRFHWWFLKVCICDTSQFLVLALRLCYYEALCIWRRSCLRIGKWRWSDSHLRLHWTKSGHRLISNRISFHSCWISITRHTIVYKLAASNLLCFLFYLRTTIDTSMCHHMNLPVSIPILWTFIWCCHKECW